MKKIFLVVILLALVGEYIKKTNEKKNKIKEVILDFDKVILLSLDLKPLEIIIYLILIISFRRKIYNLKNYKKWLFKINFKSFQKI